MSRKLLEKLCGKKKGALRRFLNTSESDPKISWYPASCLDLTEILFLQKEYIRQNPPDIEITMPGPPDIFLHTDFSSIFYDEVIKKYLTEGKNVLHKSDRTLSIIRSIEELETFRLPVDSGFFLLNSYPLYTSGKFYYIEAEVTSLTAGDFLSRIIYGFVENAAFCSELVLPNEGRFTHLICKHWGMFAQSAGYWLKNVLGRLGTEVFIDDFRAQEERDGDLKAYRLYPFLKKVKEENINLLKLGSNPLGDWYIVEKEEQ